MLCAFPGTQLSAARTGPPAQRTSYFVVMGTESQALTHSQALKNFCRQFLDPYDGDSEDAPGHSNYRSYRQRAHRLLGDRNRNTPPYTLRLKVAEAIVEDSTPPKALDLTMKAGWAPRTLEADDVDMQPDGGLKAPGPQEVAGWPARMSPSPEDWRARAASPLIPVEIPEIGRHLLSRARTTWPPARLGSERDKAPRLSLSKRKLELLLAEPERIKRKRKYVAQPRGLG